MNTPTQPTPQPAGDAYASLKQCLRARIEDNPHGTYPDELCVKAANTIELLQTALASQIEITNTERGHAEIAAKAFHSEKLGAVEVLARLVTELDRLPSDHPQWASSPMRQEAIAALAGAQEEVVDWPECSGTPSDCPENEGHGCCKNTPATTPAPAAPDGDDMLARTKKFAELDPATYVWVRGPVDQDGNSIWQRQSELYEHMKSVVEAAGFDSITACVAAANNKLTGDDHYGLEGRQHAEAMRGAYAKQRVSEAWGYMDPKSGRAIHRNLLSGTVKVGALGEVGQMVDAITIYTVPLYTHPPTAIPDGLDFEPDENHTVTDMANVGRSLMKAIAVNMPDYMWNETPAEIVCDLINERDEAKTIPDGMVVEAYAGELEELRALINTPELHDFAKGAVLEAAHQRDRWGNDHDAGKEPADWFWLLGYLAGKALKAHNDGNTEKALHHTISSAAALANWHGAILGTTNMRPGIDGEAALAAAPGSAEVDHE